MRPIVPIALVASVAVALAITVVDRSRAELAERPIAAAPIVAAETIDHDDEPFPMPVSGDALFAEPGTTPSCIAADHILGVFALDVEHVGGEILALSDGLEQAFADSWRRQVGLPPVRVSQVFAHIVPGEEGAALVDVVEIDGQGCALSRTLLAIDDWLLLLKPLRSLEV